MTTDPDAALEKLAAIYEEAAIHLREAAKHLREAQKVKKEAVKAGAKLSTLKVEVKKIPFGATLKGKSQGQAAQDYIEAQDRPVTKGEIFKALKEQGAKVASMESLSVALSRHQPLQYFKGQGWATQKVMMKLVNQSLKAGTPFGAGG